MYLRNKITSPVEILASVVCSLLVSINMNNPSRNLQLDRFYFPNQSNISNHKQTLVTTSKSKQIKVIYKHNTQVSWVQVMVLELNYYQYYY